MGSKIIEEFRKRMESRTDEEKAETLRQIEDELAFQESLTEQGYKYNTDKSYSLKLLNDAGYFPIGICSMMCEETFIFKTEADANDAWQSRVLGYDGWWYGKRNFLKAKEEYEKDFERQVKVYWL